MNNSYHDNNKCVLADVLRGYEVALASAVRHQLRRRRHSGPPTPATFLLRHAVWACVRVRTNGRHARVHAWVQTSTELIR